MWSIARAAAFGQPRTAAKRSLNQIRTKFPTLLKTEPAEQLSKLEKREEAGEEGRLLPGGETPLEKPPRIDISNEETLSILQTHCRNRDIFLNKRQKRKHWIMSLLIHRYDTGIRDLDELNAGGLRHILTPPQHVVHDYIHANVPDTVDHRFSRKRQKIVIEQLRLQRMAEFAQEAWQVLTERQIPTLPSMETLSKTNPPVFLGMFARSLAQAEPDGSPRDYPPPKRRSPPKTREGHQRRDQKQKGKLVEQRVEIRHSW
uniref:Uncharacterized protein n=1 Tax=Odontella aurita TaxID=265563 RepID=A0A6U6HEG8_9STRA